MASPAGSPTSATAIVTSDGADMEAPAVAEPRRIPIAGLLRITAVIALLVAGWYQSYDFTGVLSLAAIWGVATIGLGLVLGAAGQISLCQASFVLVGAYFYGAVSVTWKGPTLVALIGSAAAGGAAALLVSPVLRAKGYYLALATTAVSLLADQVATTATWIPGGVAGLSSIPSLKIGPLQINTETRYLWFTVAVIVVIMLLIHVRYGVGKLRRAVQALHHDEGLLAAFGGSPALLKLNVFVVGGALAGLAGGLYAGNYNFVSDQGFGLQESFALALAVMIGGSGRLMGALLGAIVYEMSYTILPNSVADYRFAFLGAIVIATMHFFPRGLMPSREDFKGWIPTRRRRATVEVDASHHELDPIEPLEVELRGVTKQFGALRAVDRLTLTIDPGKLTALIGPNGAGKTTLLDMIAGEQHVTSGRIAVGGADVTNRGRVGHARMGIARTYQRVRLVPSLNVLDNVLLGVDQAVRRDRRASEAERRRRAEAALEDVGMANRWETPVATLTFGERRLVEMARAIASRPRLVLLDEPSSGLNDAEIDAFAEVIRRLHGTGCTIILVEHNLPFVRALAEDIIALDFGRLLAHGETEQVFELPAFQEAYVGLAEEHA
jgi:ABC-type branched-subunit amino acid transport system ATPase component/ABC-type branched-subunit amino acid transport system permease subunit